MKRKEQLAPDRIGSYFRAEWLPLTFVTVSGVLYNIGLLASPWFEGRLAQCLADILGGNETAGAMAAPVVANLAVTPAVQGEGLRAKALGLCPKPRLGDFLRKK